MSTVTFLDWLQSQQSRDDDVGTFARTACGDPDFNPLGREGPDEIADFMKIEWRADDEVIGLMRSAWAEYQRTVPDDEKYQPPPEEGCQCQPWLDDDFFKALVVGAVTGMSANMDMTSERIAGDAIDIAREVIRKLQEDDQL